MRRGLKWSIIGTVGVIVILAVILIPLYCVERPVNFEVIGTTNDTQIDRTLDGFLATANANVAAYNENFFDIHVRELQTIVTHPLYGDHLSNTTVRDITLNSRGETVFVIPLNLTYHMGNDPNLQYVLSLADNCSLPQGTVYFDVQVDAQYKVWAKSGSMNVLKAVTIPCPISGSSLDL